MQDESFAQYVAYFRQIATNHKGIQDFLHGPTKRIISKSRSGMKYPLFWLETPDFTVEDHGSGNTTSAAGNAFIILKNGKLTPDQEDGAWDETLEIVKDVLRRMHRDRGQRKFLFDLSGLKIEPISTLSVDNDFGWRVEFSRATPLDLCYKAEKWEDE